MIFSLTSLCNPDAFKRENLNTSLQSCRDSKASYYKIIVYSILQSGPFQAEGCSSEPPDPPPPAYGPVVRVVIS